MAVIDVRGIGKAYSGVTVLSGIDLAVEAGGVLGLLGPNGAGKTTLIKILAGLLRPDAGGGTVLGHDLLRGHHAIRGSVSLVATSAEVGIDNSLTVRQNMEFWAPVYGLRGREARERIDGLLERLDLASRASAWPMHVSAGQRQRLSLARSLLARNPLVFLDEPTNKLDVEGVKSVRALLADMNRNEGVTVVLTTHVMEEAEELCAAIALLDRGRLIAHRPTRELVRSLAVARPVELAVRPAAEPLALEGLARVPSVVGAPRSEAVDGRLIIHLDSVDLRATTPALLEWVQSSGARLLGMRAEPVTLEDVFHALTGGSQ